MPTNNKLRLNLPLVDVAEISLEDNAEKVYTYLRSQLNAYEKLEEIEQLGIVHYAMELPVYNKWLYVKIVLGLIEIMSRTLGGTLRVQLALRKNKMSIKEFLQAMILVDQLGHLPLTYTSEHALLGWILTKTKNGNDTCGNTEDNMLPDSIKQELKNGGFKEEEIDAIIEQIEDLIYNQQDVFKFHRVISFLRVLQTLKEIPKEGKSQKEIANILREISLAVLFDYKYPDSRLWDIFPEKEKPTSEQLHKISKAFGYFHVIKKLSFLILDGSISSAYATINPYSILQNIERFLPRYDWEKTPYQKLLDDMEEFYANTLYRAPVTSFYHHFVVLKLQDFFEKTRGDKNNCYEILKEIISAKEDELKQNINEILNKLKEHDLEGYFHLRIPILKTRLDKPLELEIELSDSISQNGHDYPDILVGIRQTQSPGPYFLDIFLKKKQRVSQIRYLSEILEVLNKVSTSTDLTSYDLTDGSFGGVLEFLLEHYLNAINPEVEIVKLGVPPLILRDPNNLTDGFDDRINSSESIELKCIRNLAKEFQGEENTEKNFPLMIYRHVTLRSPCGQGKEQHKEHRYIVDGAHEVNVDLIITSKEYCYSEIDFIIIDLKRHSLYFGEVKTSKLKPEQLRRQFRILLDKDLSKSQAERILTQNTGSIEGIPYRLLQCSEDGKGKLICFELDRSEISSQ
ncbi:hypothetical protein [Thermococcus sp.]|uniref:hypothetical protein n=1 Tax=Thermococcus sp. TaxID=35749 RepID=UPI002619B52C|nr:hypothetical protein [Thermococcus sp.]